MKNRKNSLREGRVRIVLFRLKKVHFFCQKGWGKERRAKEGGGSRKKGGAKVGQD